MSLHRYPVRKHDQHQAWDAADTLLLEHAAKEGLTQKRLLVLNDSFGAIACGLSGADLTAYTDSYLSYRATQLNSHNRIEPLHDLAKLTGFYDEVLVRIPKNLTFFEEELARLSHHLPPGARVTCGAMLKHLPKSAFSLLEKYIGPVKTSLAQKKARLIFATFEKAPAPIPLVLKVKIDRMEHALENRSNLFSREKLDVGTRFLLGHLPDQKCARILDLGCGNGILGISAKLKHPEAQLVFTDESWMAVESARFNYHRYFPLDNQPAEFLWTHSYEQGPTASVDLVLCNPPFHHGHAVADFTARHMFADAQRVLKPGGILRVVGNTHLRYPSILKKQFGETEVIATHSKFVIVDAIK